MQGHSKPGPAGARVPVQLVFLISHRLETLGEGQRVAVVAASGDAVAPRRWVPRRFGPLDWTPICHGVTIAGVCGSNGRSNRRVSSLMVHSVATERVTDRGGCRIPCPSRAIAAFELSEEAWQARVSVAHNVAHQDGHHVLMTEQQGRHSVLAVLFITDRRCRPHGEARYKPVPVIRRRMTRTVVGK